ncbi:TMEM175 family protein [Streptococcus saliviloxodontae]|uniref:Membrane protein n=1 Tax=Streptococcus saliviloxodontae TaxID=1349416 RepID=A0ABS2PL52_9STRE|nr:TMEM175 family protein [Streptococcus saliviloxodontae]MBM7636017.1 putative membrane protein [Streptococcus saliviloxodontae]
MKKIIERFDVLSDAIIAIVMTILVLEIKAPTTSEQLPDFIKEVSLYLISFVLLSNIWYRRAKIIGRQRIARSESFLIDVVAHALMTLFPLAIKLLVSYDDTQVAIIIFGVLNLLVMSLVNLIPIVELSHGNRTEVEQHLFDFYVRIFFFRIIVNIILIIVASYLGRFGVYIYLFLPIADFISSYLRDRKVEQYWGDDEALKEMMAKRSSRRNEK